MDLHKQRYRVEISEKSRGGVTKTVWLPFSPQNHSKLRDWWYEARRRPQKKRTGRTRDDLKGGNKL